MKLEAFCCYLCEGRVPDSFKDTVTTTVVRFRDWVIQSGPRRYFQDELRDRCTVALESFLSGEEIPEGRECPAGYMPFPIDNEEKISLVI